MKKTARILYFVMTILLLLQNGKIYAAEDFLPSGILASDLEENVDQFVEEHADNMAGMAVAVFDENEEILKKYYGYVDVENQIAVKEDSVFEWGSATKLLVWVSVMQLYEQGKLELDADVRNYLPEGFLTNLNFDTPVTMLHLMNHNAGFQEDYVDLFVKDATYFSDLGEALAAHEPEQIYEPGTVTAYSNWGVSLAAFVVELVSGLSFCDYVHENIFEPLEMEHSALAVDLSDQTWVKEKRKELQCYTSEGKLIPDCFYYITLYPAGMCTSTLSDFEKFARSLLEEDSVLFQHKETREEMFSPTSCFGTSGIPLNCHGFWTVNFGVQTVGHGGNTAGCSSYLLLDLEGGIGAVVMTNQANETVYNFEMMELLFGSYERKLYAAEEEIPSGVYRTARTVRKGPLKFLSLSYRMGEVDDDEFWVVDDSTGVRKIVYSYGDYVEVPMYLFLLEMGLFLLWVAALIFSIVTLFVKFLRLIIQKLKKQEKTKHSLSRWSTLACLLQILIFFLLVGVIGNVSAYSLGETYVWMFAVMGILAVIFTVMSVYGIIRNRTETYGRGAKIFYFCTAVFLLITAGNVFYWNLLMFWAL